jgi:hypothetical protein
MSNAPIPTVLMYHDNFWDRGWLDVSPSLNVQAGDWRGIPLGELNSTLAPVRQQSVRILPVLDTRLVHHIWALGHIPVDYAERYGDFMFTTPCLLERE